MVTGTRRTNPIPRTPRRKSGGITLRDVAKLAGVSVITASRALNTPEALTAETLAKVRDAVARTGYVPNLLAGGLASARSRLVAALIPAIAGSVFLETIQALTEELESAGFQLILGQSGYAKSREDALIDALIGRRPDGIVLTGVLHSSEGRKRLAASGIAVVETWDLTPTPIDMLVGFSHERVGEAVAAMVRAAGSLRPAIVTADDHRAGLRRAGFERAAQAAGMQAPTVITVAAPSSLAQGRSAFAELLQRAPDTDAVYCSSDLLAHGVLTEAQARGLAIPGRLKVIGFGDLAFAAHTHPPLTTVRVDGTAIGRQAAHFIIDRVAGRDPGLRVRDIGFSIITRNTT
jgi:LacI family gluconate utilization system Gnt-I transcriptional repressor